MTTWAVILAVAAGSYVLRALPLLLHGRWTASPRAERAIGHAGTAALAALIATGLSHGSTTPVEAVATFVAGAAGLLVAVRRATLAKVMLTGGAAHLVVLAVGQMLA